jgi:hypothetical protein
MAGDLVVVTAGASLVTLPGIELATVGEWNLGSGLTTFTRDDMAAAVGAVECKSVRRPVLKLGHSEPPPKGQKRWDGEPAIGWIENMSLAEGGDMITGDYAGVPSWLAEIMSTAYPDRSIEATRNFKCQTGHVHPFVITAVALLGVTPPGIGVLDSITAVKTLFEVEAGADPITGEKITVTQSSDQERPMPQPIQITAAVTAEDIRREYYEDANMMCWITEMVMDPMQLIIRDESTGEIYRVPFSIDGKNIVFSEPIEVDIEYVDAPPNETETEPAASAAPTRVIFAGAAESAFRSALPPRTPDPEPVTPAPEPVTPPTPRSPAKPVTAAKAAARIHGAPLHKEGSQVEFSEAQLAELRKTLGLADDAEMTPERVLQASGVLAEHKAEITAAGPNTIVIDASVWTDMQNRIKRGEEARRVQLETERDTTLTAAMAAGKFPPARLTQWQKVWASDPEGTRDLIASLTPGLVPVSEIGYPGDPDAYNGGEFDTLFPPSGSGQEGR